MTQLAKMANLNEDEIKAEVEKLENLFEVTNLCRSQAHHIPNGTFARMITFKDPNRARQRKREESLKRKDEKELEKHIL